LPDATGGRATAAIVTNSLLRVGDQVHAGNSTLGHLTRVWGSSRMFRRTAGLYCAWHCVRPLRWCQSVICIDGEIDGMVNCSPVDRLQHVHEVRCRLPLPVLLIQVSYFDAPVYKRRWLERGHPLRKHADSLGEVLRICGVAWSSRRGTVLRNGGFRSGSRPRTAEIGLGGCWLDMQKPAFVYLTDSADRCWT
jgi:hypothetical protein